MGNSSERKPLLDKNQNRVDYRQYRNQIIAVAGATLTLLPTGNTTGYSSVTIPELMIDPNILASEEDISWIASLLTIGLVVGTLIGGFLSDRIGRKPTIILSSLGFSVGWIIIGVGPSVGYVFAGRLLTGVMAGINSITIQVYICESVDPSIRGVSGSLPTLMVCVGVLMTYIMGSFLNWRMLAYASGVIPLLLISYVVFLPESPVWLISKGRHTEANQSLLWLLNDKNEAEDQISKIQSVRDRRHSLTKIGTRKDITIRRLFSKFTKASVLRPLGIGMGLFFFQKFCGVSAITFYATLIFRSADDSLNVYMQTIILGLVRLLATLLGVVMIKRFKRKTLLIASGLIMFISEGVLGGYYYYEESVGAGIVFTPLAMIENVTQLNNGTTTDFLIEDIGSNLAFLSYIPLVCVILFMFGTCVGFATIPWFLIAEMMPSDVRSLACSIGYGFCQLSQFVSVKTYFNLVSGLGNYGTFWLYSGISLFGAIFVVFLVPETSNLNASQIEKLFERTGPRKEKDLTVKIVSREG